RLSLTGFGNCQTRNQFESSFSRETFETREMSGLGQPTVLVAIHRDPHVEGVVQTLRAAPEVNTPQLVFTGNVAQRLERNRDLNRVAILSKRSLRLHDQIKTEVFALAFGPNTVGL